MNDFVDAIENNQTIKPYVILCFLQGGKVGCITGDGYGYSKDNAESIAEEMLDAGKCEMTDIMELSEFKRKMGSIGL